MKKFLFTTLFAILVGSLAMAQQAPQSKAQMHKYHHQHYGHHHRHHGMALSKTLNFSDQQKLQLQTMRQDFRKKMDDLNKNESITVKAMRDQKAALIREQRTAFQNLLTPEQKNKLDDMRKHMAQKRQEMASRRIDKMKEKLSLSDEQTAKIKTLDSQFRENLKKNKENTSLDRTAKKEAFIEMFKQHKEELQGILTPEQLNKLQEWKKERTGRL
jgi:Spy/CpxP family protein refolding chaperone